MCAYVCRWLNYANTLSWGVQWGWVADPPTEEMTGFQEGGGQDHGFQEVSEQFADSENQPPC